MCPLSWAGYRVGPGCLVTLRQWRVICTMSRAGSLIPGRRGERAALSSLACAVGAGAWALCPWLVLRGLSCEHLVGLSHQLLPWHRYCIFPADGHDCLMYIFIEIVICLFGFIYLMLNYIITRFSSFLCPWFSSIWRHYRPKEKLSLPGLANS